MNSANAFDQSDFSVYFSSVQIAAVDAAAHDLVVGLTHDGNHDVEDDDQDKPLIYEPECPNDSNHRPCDIWITCSLFKPKGVHRGIKITESISIYVKHISGGKIHPIVVIFEDFDSESLKHDSEKDNPYEEKDHTPSYVQDALP